MIVEAKMVNQTFVTCEVPQPLGSVGTLDLYISYSTDVKQMSLSNFKISIIDSCLPGYYCSDTFYECPQGHYCPGEGIISYPKPC